MLNLSLTTSDMWAALIHIFAYHEKVDWMYFIAFYAVAVGLVIYSWDSKDDESETRTEVGENMNNQNKKKDEELGIGNQDRGSAVGSCITGDGKNDCTPTVLEEKIGSDSTANIKDAIRRRDYQDEKERRKQ